MTIVNSYRFKNVREGVLKTLTTSTGKLALQRFLINYSKTGVFCEYCEILKISFMYGKRL